MATIGQYKGVDITRGTDAQVAEQMQRIDSTPKQSSAIPADSLVSTQNPPQLPPAPTDTRIISNNQVAIPEQGAVQAEAQQPQTVRESMEQKLVQMMSPDNKLDKGALREELRIAEKQKKSQDIENQIISRQRSYNDQIERLQSNPDRSLNASKLNAQQNLLSREFSRELAELSFAQKIANDDYMGAEKILSDRIADFNSERQWEMQVFNTAFNFVMNDMTESEKLEANQAFQEKQNERNFEQQIQLAQFNSQLRTGEQQRVINAQAQQERARLERMTSMFQPSMSFDDFVSQREEQLQMSLANREALRPEFEKMMAQQQRMQVAQLVATGDMSPQQAEFVQNQMGVGIGGEISPEAKMVISNPALLEQYTPTRRSELLDEIAQSGGTASTAAQESMDNMVDRALESIDTLLDIKTPMGRVLSILPGRESGESGVRRITGLSKLNPMNLIPGSAGMDAKNQLETVKSILTLPTLEMAVNTGRMNREVFNTLKGASQTLETTGSDSMMLFELQRMREALLKTKAESQGRGASSFEVNDSDYQEYLRLISQ